MNAKTQKPNRATPTKATKRAPRRAGVPLFQTGRDMRDAVLVMSVLINLIVLCLWIILQKTSVYDQALFDFFIHR